MGSTNYHLCLDIRGVLMNWSNRELQNCFRHDNGRRMSAQEAKYFLMDELAKGRKVIPTCECDNFDYQRGCQGHRNPEPDATITEAL